MFSQGQVENKLGCYNKSKNQLSVNCVYRNYFCEMVLYIHYELKYVKVKYVDFFENEPRKHGIKLALGISDNVKYIWKIYYSKIAPHTSPQKNLHNFQKGEYFEMEFGLRILNVFIYDQFPYVLWLYYNVITDISFSLDRLTSINIWYYEILFQHMIRSLNMNQNYW